METAVEALAETLAEVPLLVVVFEDETSKAAILTAAASDTTMMMAWVLPVGRSGWIEASTTNKLSVP